MVGVATMSGVKTGYTWQKCSLHLRERGSENKFGMCILPATLEMMLGGGHSWEYVPLRTLGASQRGSRA